jgi:hypothetical protein
MEFSKDDYETISKALIMANNLTETEWLNMEKRILESYSLNENASPNVFEMWNQLHRKIGRTIENMKNC